MVNTLYLGEYLKKMPNRPSQLGVFLVKLANMSLGLNVNKPRNQFISNSYANKQVVTIYIKLGVV